MVKAVIVSDGSENVNSVEELIDAVAEQTRTESADLLFGVSKALQSKNPDAASMFEAAAFIVQGIIAPSVVVGA